MHSPETMLPSSHERMGPTSCLELEPTSSASGRKYSIVRNYTITFPENTSILQHDPSSMHLSLLEPWHGHVGVVGVAIWPYRWTVVVTQSWVLQISISVPTLTFSVLEKHFHFSVCRS